MRRLSTDTWYLLGICLAFAGAMLFLLGLVRAVTS